MTHTEKLQKVKEKIIEAVPDIMEWQFGCKVILKKEDKVYGLNGFRKIAHVIKDLDQVVAFVDSLYCEEYKVSEIKEILGRDIRLTDVLIALRQHVKKRYSIDYYGNFGELKYDLYQPNFENWNLEKDNLEDQSEETISFLYSLFYPNDNRHNT